MKQEESSPLKRSTHLEPLKVSNRQPNSYPSPLRSQLEQSLTKSPIKLKKNKKAAQQVHIEASESEDSSDEEEEQHEPNTELLEMQKLIGRKEHPQEKEYRQNKKKQKKKQFERVPQYSKDDLERKLQTEPVDWKRVVYQCYFMLLGSALVVLSALSYTDYTPQSSKYEVLFQNWNRTYIEDIQVGLPSENCPDGYEFLIYYEWPGTKDGCDCSKVVQKNQTGNRFLEEDLTFEEPVETIKKHVSQSNNTSHQFLNGKICNSSEIARGCSTVRHKNPQVMSAWNDGNNGKPFRLCAKRHESYNFIKIQSATLECKNDEIKCGNDEINFFCVPKGKQCPINFLGFAALLGIRSTFWEDNQNSYMGILDQILNNTDESDSRGLSIKLNENLHFFGFRNYDQYPIISELKITESVDQEGICLDTNQINITPNRSDYILMNKQRQFCETDIRYKPFHYIDEKQFYTANNLVYLPRELPYYDIDSQYRWGMYYRGYIEWNLECRGQLFNETLDKISYLKDIEQAQLGQIWMSGIYFMLVSVVFSVVTFMSAFGFQWSCITKKNSYQIYRKFQLIEISIKILIKLAVTAMISVAFALTHAKQEFLKRLLAKDCTDQPTTVNHIFFSYNQFLSSIKRVLDGKVWLYDLIMLVLFVVSILIDVCFQMYVWKHRALPQQNPQVYPDPNGEESPQVLSAGNKTNRPSQEIELQKLSSKKSRSHHEEEQKEYS